jgi:3D (Asp-Asp-Asp) domain-containing protein
MKNSLYSAVSLASVFWLTVSMSAYTPHETGSRTTASGAKAKEGYTCAANFVPLGSVIIYNGHKYYVQDRMNPRYNRHVDIFMESYNKALQFGRKEARVQVITSDDRHLKLPDKKYPSKHIKAERKAKAKPVTTQKPPVNPPVPGSAPRPATVLKPQARP